MWKWLNEAHEWNFESGPWLGGLTLLPYQLAIGISVGIWPCISGRVLRLYLGPLKFWVSHSVEKMGEAGVKVTSSRVKTLQEQLQYYQELWRDAEARAVNARELLQANLICWKRWKDFKKENQELVARLRKEHTDETV